MVDDLWHNYISLRNGNALGPMRPRRHHGVDYISLRNGNALGPGTMSR